MNASQPYNKNQTRDLLTTQTIPSTTIAVRPPSSTVRPPSSIVTDSPPPLPVQILLTLPFLFFVISILFFFN
jgi:hypothetical protein